MIAFSSGGSSLAATPSAAERTAKVSGSERKQVLLKKISAFFQTKGRFMAMYEVVHQNSLVSLRMCEFVCTAFAERQQGLWTTSENGELVDVELAYREWQDKDGKVHFDAFRRHKKCALVRMQMHGKSLLTNIAQLRFFQFMITNGILLYIKDNLRLIETAMSAHVAASRQHKRRHGGSSGGGGKKKRGPVHARSVQNKKVCL